MKKVVGIFIVLVAVIAVTSVIEPNFMQPGNMKNIARWTGMYGILTIGVSFVIITGGIDLSVGAIVGLTGTLLPMFLTRQDIQMSPLAAIALVILVSLVIGLVHGLLITKLKLQPFVVTLCGLFAYRGIARYISQDATQGFGAAFQNWRYLANGTLFSIPVPFSNKIFDVPVPFVLMIVVGILAAVFLNRSIYGRYLLALGNNEQAARYSGINTERMIITAYVISAVLAGFVGMLFAFDLNSVQPSTLGNFFELYAIAGAVLGGCSLRGDEGSILGVIIGTAIVRVLYNIINILGIATQLEYTVIGIVLLAGVVMDEILKRYSAARLAERRIQAGNIPGKSLSQ
jgi:ribose transport system permease protein